MISIQDLSISFSKSKVIDNISADFPLNRIYGIIGLNGAGKTTLFNCLSGILKPNAGQVTINNQPLSQKDIAYLETTNLFYSRITGNEYLNIFRATNKNFNLQALQSLLQLPLDDLIETYSTGMKKKLALLAALKQEKSIFLLDEPFNGLDMGTNKMLETTINILKQKGKTIFLSSHILEPLLTVCDSIYLLEKGTFSRTFSKDEFNRIEDELFKKIKEDTQRVVTESV